MRAGSTSIICALLLGMLAMPVPAKADGGEIYDGWQDIVLDDQPDDRDLLRVLPRAQGDRPGRISLPNLHEPIHWPVPLLRGLASDVLRIVGYFGPGNSYLSWNFGQPGDTSRNDGFGNYVLDDDRDLNPGPMQDIGIGINSTPYSSNFTMTLDGVQVYDAGGGNCIADVLEVNRAVKG